MSDRFETLIYTDCVPGQGLQGTAGLQFQARSTGADKAAQAIVQSSLLYEPPDAWMRERRPVTDYPPSFAHVHDGVYATAVGVYLGKEANGGRQGNQLTHSIVTADSSTYGLTRPAQLFGAPFWTDKPAPTTTCDPILAAAWEPGPFDAVAAQELVLGDPRGRDRLTTLVVALDAIGGPDERRVLFIAEDAAAVLQWTAAATLLVPQRKALTIGIKVFTLKPAYAPQPVIAVHPGWGSTSATVDNDGGYVVIDLVGGRFTELTGDLARRRVDLLCDHDPYDVLDLIEYADRIGLPDAADNLDLAVAMTLAGGPVPMDARLARVSVNWLRDSSPDLLSDRRGVLADQLCEHVERWDRDVLLALDTVAAAGQVPADKVATIRLALIRAELDRVARKQPGTPQTLAALGADVWRPEHDREAQQLVADALRDSGTNSVFDALLKLARHLGVAVHAGDLGDTVRAFVEDWSYHPEHPYHADEWQDGRTLQRMLYAKITARVDAGEHDKVGDAWWRRQIDGKLSLERSFDRAVLAAGMLHGDTGRRKSLLRTYAGDRHQAADAVDVLYTRTEPTYAELRALIDVVPEHTQLPDHLFGALRNELIDLAEPIKAGVLDLAIGLAAKGLYSPSPPVRKLIDGDAALAALCAEMRTLATPDELQHFTVALRSLDARLRNMWSSKLAAALMQVTDARNVPPILPALGARPAREYLSRLAAVLDSRQAYTHLVTAFVLVNSKHLDGDEKALFKAKVLTAMDDTGDKRLKALGKEVEAMSPAWVTLWDKTLEESRKPSLLSRLPKFRGGTKG